MKERTLCWKCANFAKCSWARGVPVEGWDAVPTKYIDAEKTMLSYIVRKCPQFVEDRIRETTAGEMAEMLGVSARTLFRRFNNVEKGKKTLKELEKKGYKLRVYEECDLFYLERIDNKNDT